MQRQRNRTARRKRPIDIACEGKPKVRFRLTPLSHPTSVVAMTLDTVRRNLAQIRQQIARAAEASGRTPGDIRLVGVSKYVDAATTRLLVEAGCYDLGESRPQQLWSKAAAAELAGLSINWHFIGHLQRNKADRTIAACSLIHAVDSERLLQAINESAESQNLQPRVLLEVNCSGERAKQGLTAEELRCLIPMLVAYPNVRVTGLMTMAALDDNPPAEKSFESLRLLRDELQRSVPPNAPLTELSMGMSGDFPAAIRQGATLVRIGSALWEALP